MYQKPDNDFSNQERKLARRKLLLGTSAVAGAAAIAAVGGGLALSGAHAAPASGGSTKPVKLYRLVNKDYLYLPDPAEVQTAQTKYGYKLEGVAGYVYPPNPDGSATPPVDGTSPVYRWNNGTEHFYTADKNEKPSGYKLEGIQFFAYAQAADLVGASIPKGYGPTAFYRLTNGTIHFYTGDTQELLSAQKQYKYFVEGAGFFVLFKAS